MNPLGYNRGIRKFFVAEVVRVGSLRREAGFKPFQWIRGPVLYRLYGSTLYLKISA